MWGCLAILADALIVGIGVTVNSQPALISPTSEVHATNVLDYDGLAKTQIEAMKYAGTLTNVINLLASSGQFCQVRGHVWGPHAHVTLEYVSNRIGCRECKVCGLHQEQYATEWK